MGIFISSLTNFVAKKYLKICFKNNIYKLVKINYNYILIKLNLKYLTIFRLIKKIKNKN